MNFHGWSLSKTSNSKGNILCFSKLKHDVLVHMFGVRVLSEEVHVIMEYIKGEDMKEIIKSKTRVLHLLYPIEFSLKRTCINFRPKYIKKNIHICP